MEFRRWAKSWGWPDWYVRQEWARRHPPKAKQHTNGKPKGR